MADRRFGPTLGAGVVILERDPGRPIQDAPTGTTAFLGRPERGVDGIIECGQQRDYVRNCGTYRSDDEMANAAFDFYKHGRGSGRLFILPVRSGDEIDGLDVVFSRRTHRGEYRNRGVDGEQKQVLMTATAKAGFSAAGRERVQTGSVTVATDITDTTFDTGEAMIADEFVGATLSLDAVSSRTYTVISNDAAGILTVRSDSTMASDVAASATPLDGSYQLWLDSRVRDFDGPGSVSGVRAEFSLMWKDPEDNNGAALFGLDILVDGDIVANYPNLSLDPSSDYYIVNVVNNDPENIWVDFSVAYVGTYDADRRPASWYGEYTAYSGGQASTRVAWLSAIALQAPATREVGFVTAFTVPSKTVRGQIILTFTSPTAFNVTTTSARGVQGLQLASGTVGVAWTSGTDFIPGFTVQNGVDAYVTGDVLTIDVDPFPVELDTGDGLLNGWAYVNAGAGDLTRVAIGDNAPGSFDFATAPASAPTPAASISDQGATAVGIGSGSIVFPLASEGTLNVVTDLTGLATLTTTAQPYANIAALISELNTQATAHGLDPFFADDGADGVGIQPNLYTSTEVGQDCFIFNVDAEAAFNVLADQWLVGDDGDEFRIQAPRALRDAYDGTDPVDADYVTLLDPTTSPLVKLLPSAGRNLGLIKLAIPGVTSTAVQVALKVFAEAHNLAFRYEMPPGTLTEPAAVAYLNDTLGRSNYGRIALPTYMDVINPIGQGVVQRSQIGTILGLEAENARVYGGYHKPAAGVEVKLPFAVERPMADAVLDEEVLNPQGIQVIKKMRGDFVLWGMRTVGDPSWRWAAQREQISHYEQILAANLDWIIFRLNDRRLWGQLRATLLEFGQREYAKGALRGNTLEEGWTVKIDSENNTNATIEAGDVNVSLRIWPAAAVERLNLIVNKAGVFEATA